MFTGRVRGVAQPYFRIFKPRIATKFKIFLAARAGIATAGIERGYGTKNCKFHEMFTGEKLRKKRAAFLSMSVGAAPGRRRVRKPLTPGQDATRQRAKSEGISMNATTLPDQQTLAMFAHELRGPLASILYAVQSMNEASGDESTCREMGMIIERQGRFLSRMDRGRAGSLPRRPATNFRSTRSGLI